MTTQRRHLVAQFVVFLLCMFLVLFPKGGFKVGPLPITWGYLLFALTSPFLIVGRLVWFQVQFFRRQLLALACLVPFQLLFLLSVKMNGIADSSYAASIAICLFVLPFLFLVIYPAYFPIINGKKFARWFTFSIFLAAAYGIFLFIWRQSTGYFIQIPYLTVNVGDVGELEGTKHIVRGNLVKLISTYNNGNLYGGATLILLPLFDRLTSQSWKKLVVRAALLLTLSRTVWAGFVFEQVLSLVAVIWDQIETFPRVKLGVATKRILMVAIAAACIIFVVFSSSFTLNFLFDSTLGGRQTFGDNPVSWLPTAPVSAFGEIIYLSALRDYGILGFLAFTLIFISPILVVAMDKRALTNPYRRAGLKGVLLYAFLGTSDGGLVYIPILAFYWFAYMVFLFGFPSGIGGEPVLTSTKFVSRRPFAFLKGYRPDPA